MKFISHFLFGVTLLAASAHAQVIPVGTPYPKNVWSEVTHPSSGAPAPHGFYSAGCMGGAVSLALDGPGYQVMKLYRNRYYGHPSLLEFIQNLGRVMDAAGSGVLIGDLAQPRGGKLPYGHASHQTGLDADIWYWTDPSQLNRLLSVDERNNLNMRTVLTPSGAVDPRLFTEETILKLKTAATSPNVERIFVNPAIKKYLCANIPNGQNAWLRMLRPWPGHDDHFHVRLACPANAADCTRQSPVAAGTGCNSSAIEADFTRNFHENDGDSLENAPAMSPAIEALLNRPQFKPSISSTCLKILKE